MEVSDQKTDPVSLGAPQGQEPSGHNLIRAVVDLTGLPPDMIHTELHEILSTTGHSAHNVTLDELRASMIAYLEQLIVEEEGALPFATPPN